MLFIRYFIKGTIFYLYRYFIEGHDSFKFSDLLECLYSFEISQNLTTIKTGLNKNYFLANLVGSQYLFEILHTSLLLKVVNMW